jgi:Protein of unknown function (DUF3667)
VISSTAGQRCLNCDATLHGAFCSACGQRVIPPYPTMRELAGDAWQELSGYDGRFMRTLRVLLRRPGSLTVDVLEGHRARYVSPVRLYLVASVLYFLVAAAAPNIRPAPTPVVPGSDHTIDLANPDAADRLTPEQRADILKSIERAPWVVRPMLRSAVTDPAAFRRRVLENLPHTLFALVPIFAVIVSLFYRRRRFSQHLIFALHLHTVVFIAQALREFFNFTGSLTAVRIAGVIVTVVVIVYALLAFRRVYDEKWPRLLIKCAGIALLYLIVGLAALIATFAWVSLG